MIGSSDWKASSQSKQDEVIRKMLPLEPDQSRRRFFVDLAANDWQFLSNTYALETYEDWDGICIEPNDVYWKNHHKRKCALVGAGIGTRGEEVFFNFHNGGRGGMAAAAPVAAGHAFLLHTQRFPTEARRHQGPARGGGLLRGALRPAEARAAEPRAT